jgi:hypothetical protein
MKVKVTLPGICPKMSTLKQMTRHGVLEKARPGIYLAGSFYATPNALGLEWLSVRRKASNFPATRK